MLKEADDGRRDRSFHHPPLRSPSRSGLDAGDRRVVDRRAFERAFCLAWSGLPLHRGDARLSFGGWRVLSVRLRVPSHAFRACARRQRPHAGHCRFLARWAFDQWCWRTDRLRQRGVSCFMPGADARSGYARRAALLGPAGSVGGDLPPRAGGAPRAPGGGGDPACPAGGREHGRCRLVSPARPADSSRQGAGRGAMDRFRHHA